MEFKYSLPCLKNPIFVHTQIQPPIPHTHIHTHAYTHIHTYTNIHTYTYIDAYTHIHTYKHTHTYIHTHINTHTYIHTYTHTPIYGVSQEECARLRESVPYVKLYRYYPKHLCPK